MTERDFKFRLWDGREKRFLSEAEINRYRVPELNTPTLNSCGDWEQYTEVKDVNGVEFYDNDIVRVEVSQPFEEVELGGRVSVIGVVKYEEGAYWIDWGTGRTRLWSETLQMTVLGNVHQNPELLEVIDNAK